MSELLGKSASARHVGGALAYALRTLLNLAVAFVSVSVALWLI